MKKIFNTENLLFIFLILIAIDIGVSILKIYYVKDIKNVNKEILQIKDSLYKYTLEREIESKNLRDTIKIIEKQIYFNNKIYEKQIIQIDTITSIDTIFNNIYSYILSKRYVDVYKDSHK